MAWAVAKRAALHYLSSVILEMALAFLAGSFMGRAVSYSYLYQPTMHVVRPRLYGRELSWFLSMPDWLPAPG